MKIPMKAPKKRPAKRKLERPKKQYPLDQCALYGIRGLGELISVLGWHRSPADLERLADRPNNYRVWLEDGREIQEPINVLRTIHARVATLLRRVEPPDFRHSGVRKRSFLTNAQQHLADNPSIKLDIRKFYPSTSFDHVRRFFKRDLRCAGDVAVVLAKLCCYRKNLGHIGHLPTGAVHSEVLAFYCHKKIFDALFERAKTRGGTMSVYVDDIMLSMPNASLTDLEWARYRLSQGGITLHPGKSWVFPKNGRRRITGVIIQNGKTHATPGGHPNSPSCGHLKIPHLDSVTVTHR